MQWKQTWQTKKAYQNKNQEPVVVYILVTTNIFTPAMSFFSGIQRQNSSLHNTMWSLMKNSLQSLQLNHLLLKTSISTFFDQANGGTMVNLLIQQKKTILSITSLIVIGQHKNVNHIIESEYVLIITFPPSTNHWIRWLHPLLWHWLKRLLNQLI